MVTLKKNISRAFLILFVTISLLELSLSIFDPLGIVFFFEMSKYRASLLENDVYAYIHEPGYREKLQGVDVRINSHGLRGPEFEDAKHPGQKRLLILGDSAVFGWGAPQESIFPIEIQRILSKRAPEVEVIPAGVCSWNTRTEYEYLRSTAIHFKPDLVLLLIVENDLVPKRNSRTEVSEELLFGGRVETNGVKNWFRPVWRMSVGRSYLLKYTQYFIKIRNVQQSKKNVHGSSPKWEDARLALDGIIRLCKERNIDLVIYLYVSPSELQRNPALSLYNSYLENREEEVYMLPEYLLEIV